jgi:hypothetical protein
MPVLGLAALLAALLCSPAGAIMECLQRNATVEASFPDSSQYQQLQARNAQLAAASRQPAAIVQPINEAGVAAAVACSNAEGTRWVVRNGGHSYQ